MKKRRKLRMKQSNPMRQPKPDISGGIQYFHTSTPKLRLEQITKRLAKIKKSGQGDVDAQVRVARAILDGFGSGTKADEWIDCQLSHWERMLSSLETEQVDELN